MARILVCLLALTLAACGRSDSAAMPIQGSDHSLTLVRVKDYAWSNEWQLAMVVARMPDCMRRHHLKPVADGALKVEIFRSEEGRWVIHQGKRWYVADSQTCELQQFETKPPEPGTYVGSFDIKGEGLKFTISPDLKMPGEEAAREATKEPAKEAP